MNEDNFVIQDNIQYIISTHLLYNWLKTIKKPKCIILPKTVPALNS